jgi:hypothetical protein
MKKPFLFILALIFISLLSKAQETTTANDTLRRNAVKLFIDCQMCDMNHIRREIPFVNYVRDVKEADLYLREVRQSTGSGGAEFSYIFIGQEKFEGLTDTLIYSSRPDDTTDLQRQGRTNMMKLGLMRYVARTPMYNEVMIRSNGTRLEEVVVDKWNNWVFELETRPRFQWQETYKEYTFMNSASANKITEKWKFELSVDQRLTKTEYTIGTKTSKAEKKSLQLRNLIVKSIGRHWATGVRTDLQSSTFNNMKFSANIYPSIEYNLFPYSESTHHQMRFLYGVGISMNQYNDTTIYNKIKENLPEQKLQIAYQVQEKWGSVNLSLEGSNYLNDFEKNRIELEGSVNVRIIKGLSLSLRGGVAKINNQISLKKGTASAADVLLQLQQQATQYTINGNLGITYTFGSIYNNIVNPRFGTRRFDMSSMR